MIKTCHWCYNEFETNKRNLTCSDDCKDKLYKAKKKRYHQRPDVKDRLLVNAMRYRKDPKNRKKIEAYEAEYYKRPEVVARIKKYQSTPEYKRKNREKARQHYLKKKAERLDDAT